MRNLKYMTFLLLLGATGVIYFFREPVLRFLEQAVQLGWEYYEEALDLPEDGSGENSGRGESAGENSGNGESGGRGECAGENSESAENSGSAGGNGENGENGGNPDGREDRENAAGWAYVTVDEDYFSDALFIGDSRTVGLYDYAGLDNASFFASTGLTVYKLFDAKLAGEEGSRQKLTLEELLTEKQFGKIYLMIGINEMGTGTVDSFMEKYEEAVEHLEELQPDALIYLQAIMKVSKERSDKGDYITNEGIVLRNQEIAELADGKKRFFLDVNPTVCDESGGLVQEYSFDGVHLKAAYIKLWKQFLMEHAVSFS